MPGKSVLTIGKFDGVHLGHHAILRSAKDLAKEKGAEKVVVLAFDPHPATVLAPERVPPRLVSRKRREELLLEAGADEVVFLEPDEATLGLDPEVFIDQVVRRYDPVVMVEGSDFRFGHKRRGDLDMLRKLGVDKGFDVTVVEPVEVVLHDRWCHRVTSSLARWLVGHGRVEDASRVLGRCYALDSMVVEGEKRGRTIGFPTINLDLKVLSEMILPADGVYAGEAVFEDGARYPAAISVGEKPSFGRVELTVEAHLIGLDHEVYGRSVSLSFGRWVRDQLRFPSVELLVNQLKNDVLRVDFWAKSNKIEPDSTVFVENQAV